MTGADGSGHSVQVMVSVPSDHLVFYHLQKEPQTVPKAVQWSRDHSCFQIHQNHTKYSQIPNLEKYLEKMRSNGQD